MLTIKRRGAILGGLGAGLIPSTAARSASAPTAPPQAVAAGFTNLVFEDDFTSSLTITGSAEVTSGYNWYASRVNQTSPTYYTVYNSLLADELANGNDGGGSNASPNGGILRINGISSVTNEGNFQTTPTAFVNETNPKGTYKHGYWEAYMQYNKSGKSKGWPAFWAIATNYTKGTEVDFMEVLPSLGGTIGGTVHNWFPGGSGGGEDAAEGTPLYTITPDSNWHTYGFLWRSTGTGTGSITMFVDNEQMGEVYPTGTGTYAPQLENDFMYLILGTGAGWPAYWDWVRVWQ